MLRRAALALSALLVALAVPAVGVVPAQAAPTVVWTQLSHPTCPTSGGVLKWSDRTTYRDGAIEVTLSVIVGLHLNDNTVATSKVAETIVGTARLTVYAGAKGSLSGSSTVGLSGSSAIPTRITTASKVVRAALVRARARAIAQAGVMRKGLEVTVTKVVQKPGACVKTTFTPVEPVGTCSPPTAAVAACSTPRRKGSTQASIKRGNVVVPGTWVLQSTRFGTVAAVPAAQLHPTLNWTSAAAADPATDELVEASYLVKSRAGRATATLKVIGLRQVKVDLSVKVNVTTPLGDGFGFDGSLSFRAAQGWVSHLGDTYANLDYSPLAAANWKLSNGTATAPAGCDSATVSGLESTMVAGGGTDVEVTDNSRVYDPTNSLSEWAVDMFLSINLYADLAGPAASCDAGPKQLAILGFSLTEPDPKYPPGSPYLRNMLRQTFPHSRIGVPVPHTYSLDLSHMGLGYGGTAQVTMTLTPQQHA